MCLRTPFPPLTYACAGERDAVVQKGGKKHSYRYAVRTHVPLSVEPKAPGFGRGMGANEPMRFVSVIAELEWELDQDPALDVGR